MLDWGGGVGYFALLCRTILPPEVDVDFHCRDVPLVCDAGRELLPEVTFWTDDACLEREYDLVVASSSLQYAEDWRALLGRLARRPPGTCSSPGCRR